MPAKRGSGRAGSLGRFWRGRRSGAKVGGRGGGHRRPGHPGGGGDLEAGELLDYFREDPNTKVVGAYLEGVRDGRAFFQALKRCAREKPVVIYKGGLTETGAAGTLSHTGSLAGSLSAWTAAIRQAGAITAAGRPDLVECLMACLCLPAFTGMSLGVMAGG